MNAYKLLFSYLYQSEYFIQWLMFIFRFYSLLTSLFVKEAPQAGRPNWLNWSYFSVSTSYSVPAQWRKTFTHCFASFGRELTRCSFSCVAPDASKPSQQTRACSYRLEPHTRKDCRRCSRTWATERREWMRLEVDWAGTGLSPRTWRQCGMVTSKSQTATPLSTAFG